MFWVAQGEGNGTRLSETAEGKKKDPTSSGKSNEPTLEEALSAVNRQKNNQKLDVAPASGGNVPVVNNDTQQVSGEVSSDGESHQQVGQMGIDEGLAVVPVYSFVDNFDSSNFGFEKRTDDATPAFKVFDNNSQGMTELSLCQNIDTQNHFIDNQADCLTHNLVGTLGWVRASVRSAASYDMLILCVHPVTVPGGPDLSDYSVGSPSSDCVENGGSPGKILGYSPKF